MSSDTKRKSCLHLVVKCSPGSLEACHSQFETGDSVLFLDDGVMHLFSACDDSLCMPATACHFSGADLEARALTGLALASGVRNLTDQEGAELILKHELCLTWK